MTPGKTKLTRVCQRQAAKSFSNKLKFQEAIFVRLG
jgi:hypothetical protein